MAVIYGYILIIIALLFAMNLAGRSRYVNKYKNRFFLAAVLVNIVLLATEATREFSQIYGFTDFYIFSKSVNFAFAPLLPYSIMLMNRKHWGKKEKLLGLPAVGIIVLSLSSRWTEWMFYLGDGGAYCRGPLYKLGLLVSIGYFILLVVTAFREYRDTDFGERIYLSFILSVSIFGVVLQVFVEKISSMWTTCGVCLLLYYTFELEMRHKYDILTGVRNRIAFDSYKESLGKGAEFTLVLFDINGLKPTNDLRGHVQGDKLIMQIARLIANHFYGIGRVYRIGGGEFFVICDGVGADKVRVALNNLEYAAARMSRSDELEYSVSYGLSHHGEGDAREFCEVFHEADEKMYQMKGEYYQRTGKDRRRR